MCSAVPVPGNAEVARKAMEADKTKDIYKKEVSEW